MTIGSDANSTHKFKIPRHSFLALLICLLALLIAPAYALQGERAILWMVIYSCILLASLYLVVRQKKEFVIGVFLIIPALVSAWLENITNTSDYLVLNSFLSAAFLIYISFNIGRFLFETEKVTLEMIYASMCLYLMIGLIWTYIYVSIEVNNSGSFSGLLENPAVEASSQFLRSQFSYYSYVTLSTLGYGDISPLTKIARAWATFEAIIGQFYLAIVIARLVGLHITSAKE